MNSLKGGKAEWKLLNIYSNEETINPIRFHKGKGHIHFLKVENKTIASISSSNITYEPNFVITRNKGISMIHILRYLPYV